jgi:hypothetical protein
VSKIMRRLKLGKSKIAKQTNEAHINLN